MKHAKKLVSILLVLAMALTLSVVAFAATITVTPATVAENSADPTYKIYKIFDLTIDGENKKYTIANTSVWYDVVTAYTGDGIELIETTPAGTYIVEVETKDDGTTTLDPAAFAAYLKANIPATASAAATLTGDDYTAEDLDVGYYFIDSNVGALCALKNATDAITVAEKNEVPTVDKKVQEDSDGSWGETNDADLGQVVNFQTTINVETGAIGYVLHDKMSDGLTLDASTIKVSVDGTTITAGDNTYTVYTNGFDDECDFEIEFADEWIATQVDKAILVEYSATVNANAVIGNEDATGNFNETWLNYGDKSELESTHETTETFVWEFGAEKVIAGTTTALAGATFTLSKNSDGSNPLAFTQNGAVYTYGTGGNVTEFVTPADGNLWFEGLDADTYYLTETAAPAGYNLLDAPIVVVIDNAGNVKFDGATEADADKTVTVENSSGTQLPETGGIGTTIFYIVGGLLAVGAVVLLVSKKRMSLADAAE